MSEFLTFAEWKTLYNVPANYTLSQIFPAALGISDIDDYFVPIVLNASMPAQTSYGNYQIYGFNAIDGSESLVFMGSAVVWTEVYFQFPSDYVEGDYHAFNNGKVLLGTSLTSGLPQAYGLGYSEVPATMTVWDYTETQVGELFEITYNESLCLKLFGATAFMFFLVDKSGYQEPSQTGYANSYVVQNFPVNYDVFAPIRDEYALACEVTDVYGHDPHEIAQLPPPTHLTTSHVTSNSARVHWESVENASGYKVEYRASGTSNWTEG